MAIKLPRTRRDDRVQRILSDPQGYFAQARKEAAEQVRREMGQRQVRRKRPAIG